MSEADAKKPGWFGRLKAGLSRSSGKISSGITGIFTKAKLDDDTLEELEDLLIMADLGVPTAAQVCAGLAKERYNKAITAEEVKTALAEKITEILEPLEKPLQIDTALQPHVVLVVGVNGGGKTTTIAKLGKTYLDDGKSLLLAAGDTFRAAAVDQLKVWGKRLDVDVVTTKIGGDAAGLAFDAVRLAGERSADVLLIDTAGRLQNKDDLMAELEKIRRVIGKQLDTAPHDVVLVLDATTGQNALNQIEVFKDIAGVTGLIMTKLDGTARGGVLVAAAEKFGLPIHAIGVGEGMEDLRRFNAADFAKALVGVDAEDI
ncbi:MAG: signal recognition particle-docking protein FtsY [Pseudomonadota bacterium]